MKTLSIDLESFSSEDITKTGAYRYCEAWDFEVILFAWSEDYGPVQLVDLLSGEELPPHILSALSDPNVLKTAYNAAFERTAIASHFGIQCPPEQWECTMVLAATMGLPLGLDAVSKALKLTQDKAKLATGKALIKYFCCPCKPTKVNGGRSRNLPEDAPDKWDEFKAYCVRDVEAENEIRNRLERWRPGKDEKRFWDLDQKINDRGVRVDTELATNAILFSDKYKEVLTRKAVLLSGLENPGSVAQVKAWLEEQEGIEVASLKKDVLPDVLKQINGSRAKEFMAIRAELSKSSVKKYDAMMRSVCSDGNARGLFQFYGAVRTGRFAGRNIQLQNLPRNYLKDLEYVRALVRAGQYEELEILHENISNVLSELIRTALVPELGHKFIVADFSAIEARVIAWFAKEQWVLEEFRGEGKIYEATASTMFGVPKALIKKGNPEYELRQKGKAAALACIAEGSEVLTQRGLVPIELVQHTDLLWDGVEWVKHEGVVYKGERRVITYDGLTATPDHLVWTEGSNRPIPFGVASTCGKRILQSGNGRQEIWVGRDYKPRKEIPKRVESVLCLNPMHRLRLCTVVMLFESDTRKVKRLPELYAAGGRDTKLVGPKDNIYAAEVCKSKRPRLRSVWGPRNRVQIRFCNVCGAVDNSGVGSAWKEPRTGPHKQRWALRERKPSVGYAKTECGESGLYSYHRVGSSRLAIQPKRCPPKAKKGTDARRNLSRCKAGCKRKTQELAYNCKVVRVYDILNAGPRHRFTVSGALVHNCGYGGGSNALVKIDRAWAANQPEDELKRLVTLWRKANPRIVNWWYSLEEAAKQAIKDRTKVTDRMGGITFRVVNGNLFADLPSGRSLCYQGVHMTENRFGNESIGYWGQDQQSKQYVKLETYGGKLAENCVSGRTLVLTRSGWKRIDRVSLCDQLWDGVEWVRHDGLIAQGTHKTISVDGVRMTPDHLVLTEEGWQNGETCERYNRRKVLLPDGYTARRLDRRWKGTLAYSLRMWKRYTFTDERVHEKETKELRLQERGVNRQGTYHARDVHASSFCRMAVHDRSLQTSIPPSMEELWWAWNNGMRQVGTELRELLGRYGSDLPERSVTRQVRQRKRIYTRELCMANAYRAVKEPTWKSQDRYAVGRYHCGRSSREIRRRHNHNTVQVEPRLGQRHAVCGTRCEERVYDIRNCGPRHRFTVLGIGGPMIVHNCVQATARDCLRDSMLALDQEGFDIRMHIHDEIVITEPINGRTVDEVCEIMGRDLEWAKGLPLRAAGFETPFYLKD